MDWNSKTSSDWDWENLAMSSAKTIEITEQVELSSRTFEGQGVKNGSLYSSAIAGISSSDLSYRSSSRSSISPSADSSLKEGVKTFSTIEGFPKDCGQKEEVAGVNDCGNFPTLAASVKSGEPMIGLKLAKWTYFENVCVAGTNKTTSLPESGVATKRSRMTYQSALNPRCQVEGCNLDLKSAKDYHRRHRICETHSKSPWVIVAGLERRFCQQCSRFHDLSEFDDKKRSCRRRLSDHNARRRKPQPAVMPLNSARLSSSLHDGRQKMNLLWNRAKNPVSQPTWQNACNFKVTQSRDSLVRPSRTAGIERQAYLSSDEMSNCISILHPNSDRILSFQSTTARVLNHDLAPSALTSNLDVVAPDLQCALSLLSTSSWGLNEPEPTSVEQFMHVNQRSVAQPSMHAGPQNEALASSRYIRVEQPPAMPHMHSLDLYSSGSSQFQEFQSFKPPFELGCFYPNQIN